MWDTYTDDTASNQNCGCVNGDTCTCDDCSCGNWSQWWSCSGWWDPLAFSVDQIKRINEILGHIDDEDLETGNYDLTEAEAKELNDILFGKK